ncbi:MAG TPA: NHL repeat-containing protein, partial [Streptosporangiaceae bacterium]
MSAESRPLGITAGPDGNLWFTEGAGRIGRITPQGAITEFSTGISPGAEPTGIAAGPDGNLWFTESAGNRIGRITPTGAVTEFPLGISPGSLKSIPQGIAAGPDGNLWFTEAAGNRIGRITPQGALTWFQTGISPKSTPKGITVGPDGNLWFTERGGIGRITSSGAVTEFRTGISPQSRPSGIAPGPDGNLWFTEVYGTHIGRITPQGAVTWFRPRSVPSGITAGPDGNLWFTEALGRIGRITPQGAVTEFSAGITVRSSPAGLRSSPVGIAAGPDGNLWFTEAAGDRIGRITPQGVISEYPPTAVIGDARLRDTQAVGVPVRCPSGAARECRGTLTLLDLRGRRLGVRRFRVAPARRAEVVVPLWAAGRRRLRAQGSLQVQVVLVPSAHSTAGMVSRRAVLATAATRTTLAGSWRRLPAAPLPKGTGQLTAAWTGSSMILYGRGSHNVAAAYAPATNTWRRLSPPRGPGGAYEGTNRSVWTGTEMLVAGIPTVAYDPLTGRWRTLPRASLTLITGLVVWTGREVIGWGGGCCGEAWNGGAAYNPATGSSRT